MVPYRGSLYKGPHGRKSAIRARDVERDTSFPTLQASVMNPATGKDFEQHFVNQLGEGMPVFSGPRTQRGYGLGHVLRHIGKSAVPIIKHAGKEAIKKGIETVVEDL